MIAIYIQVMGTVKSQKGFIGYAIKIYSGKNAFAPQVRGGNY